MAKAVVERERERVRMNLAAYLEKGIMNSFRHKVFVSSFI